MRQEPTVIFTCDTDWADDDNVSRLIRDFDVNSVPLTVFATNVIPSITRFMTEHPSDIAPHFNFMPGSTHGNTEDEIIASLTMFKSECYRNHCFYDNSRLTSKLYGLGFRYDSNICLWLQQDVRPLFLASGIRRFPVWFEDDVALSKGLNFTQENKAIDEIIDDLLTPGLKVLNFHPQHFIQMRALIRRLIDCRNHGFFHPFSLREAWLNMRMRGE